MTQPSTNSRYGLIAVLLMVLGGVIGVVGWTSFVAQPPQTSSASAEKEIAYWVAPMDPDYRRDEPGKSPMGMDLIPVYVGEEPGGADVGFTVSANIRHNLGVKTTAATLSDFSQKVEATGRITYDETRIARLQMRAEGWVEELIVRAVGTPVKAGDLLFTFYSPEISIALTEFGQAKASGSARFQAAARGRLKAFGLTDKMIEEAEQSGDWSAPMNIYAPAPGIVTRLEAREGSMIDTNTIAFEIIDQSNYWLIVDVFESQIADVFVGQSVDIHRDGYRSQGIVDYIYPELDPVHKTIRIRVNLPNVEGALMVGQFFEVELKSSPAPALTVPDTAVIRLGSGNRVVLDLGDGQFQVAEVELGPSSDGRTVVTAGLSEGERVVVSGQFMLDSESSFSGAELRMISDHSSEQAIAEADGPTFGMGTLNSIDIENRTVNISHQPIEALGWPAMTMDLSVGEAVDLSELAAPATIHFGLEQLESGGVIISVIHVMSSDMGDM